MINLWFQTLFFIVSLVQLHVLVNFMSFQLPEILIATRVPISVVFDCYDYLGQSIPHTILEMLG